MPDRVATPPLYYRSEGKGPLVIMIHGLLMDGQCWRNNGVISALSSSFHVVCPDLIGHGASDKPDNPALYSRENQALSIVNLMDELGYEKAHVVGYSAGAWLTLGLLDLYPQRLSSVVLGGWDCLKGLPETPYGKLTFDMFISFARETAPELTRSLSAQDEKGVEHFFNALSRPPENVEPLFTRSTPKLLWAGTRDPYYAAMAELAGKQGIPLISGAGDHLSEANHPDKSTIDKLLRFILDPRMSG